MEADLNVGASVDIKWNSQMTLVHNAVHNAVQRHEMILCKVYDKTF